MRAATARPDLLSGAQSRRYARFMSIIGGLRTEQTFTLSADQDMVRADVYVLGAREPTAQGSLAYCLGSGRARAELAAGFSEVRSGRRVLRSVRSSGLRVFARPMHG